MTETVEPLILDLLDWLLLRDRTYEEVMDAWRTSCPRLPVWEDANERGLIAREYVNGACLIKVSPKGLALVNYAGARS
jgi:trans-aconitate 2-methyltransferase